MDSVFLKFVSLMAVVIDTLFLQCSFGEVKRTINGYLNNEKQLLSINRNAGRLQFLFCVDKD